RIIFISEQEGEPVISEEAARHIALHGKGSYRDALGVLEQIRTSAGKVKKIADETVHRMLGIPSQDLLVDLLEGVCIKDNKKLLTTFKNLESGSALRAYDDFVELV